MNSKSARFPLTVNYSTNQSLQYAHIHICIHTQFSIYLILVLGNTCKAHKYNFLFMQHCISAVGKAVSVCNKPKLTVIHDTKHKRTLNSWAWLDIEVESAVISCSQLLQHATNYVPQKQRFGCSSAIRLSSCPAVRLSGCLTAVSLACAANNVIWFKWCEFINFVI